MRDELNQTMFMKAKERGGWYKKMVDFYVWLGICDNTTDIDINQIEAFTSPVKLNLKTGSDDNVEMLKFFESKSIHGQQIYEGPNFYLIEKQWYDLLPVISLYVLITRVLPVIFLTMFVLDPLNRAKYWLCFAASLCLLLNEVN